MKRAGFTLLELLVGLTVASLALSAGFATLAFVRERGERAEEESRVAVAGAAQRTLLMDLLAGARFRAPSGEQFQGDDVQENSDTLDTMFFPTTATTPIEGSVTIVGLYIDVNDETPEEGLVVETRGAVLGAQARRMEFVPNAIGLNIRYLPNVAGEVEWTDGWNGRNELPRAVELRIIPAAGDTLPALLRLPIRVAVGARW
jgi:prepilin-type N-terminal cleavage/methylation domain-containing protein